MIGVVKSYDARRGVGVLTPDKGGAEIAVFASEVERAGLARLTPGERFSFAVKTDDALRRSFAVKLERLTPAA
ncbi:cold shock domain-containing protein [Terricaulis sp.]|uniref:cold shock domain-containing protein n=1 Tax=Terricaulis sp. TaxID=2768686 RepID=UPI003784924E